MKTPRVSDIIGIINKIAPFGLAEEWDNSGLQTGNPASPAEKIMIALDPGKGAVESAIASGCQLLLTHHPLLFRPLKTISTADTTGQLVALSFKHDLSIVSLHTNYDIADGGLNDLLAESLGVMNCEPLKVSASDDLVKLVVFVPHGHEERVAQALFRFTVNIGNYKDCSFKTAGTGTFTPLDGAKPFLGELNAPQSVEETRLEVLLGRDQVTLALAAMKSAHPYEAPAYDLYPLLNRGRSRGLGRIGVLPEPIPLLQFAREVKERLGTGGVRLVGDIERRVRKVALCGGSGASLLRTAVRQGADVLLTGDIKYHEAREAEALGIAVIDAGHFATEVIMVEGFAGRLADELGARGYGTEVLTYKGECDPFLCL